MAASHGVADICVIGGGPAGALISSRLAVLGHNVTLIHRAKRRCSPAFETLPASIFRLLDVFGVTERVERENFTWSDCTLSWWSQEEPEFRQPVSYPRMCIDRERFDMVLRGHAQEVGVRVFEPARVTQIQHLAAGAWKLQFLDGIDKKELSASYVIDASGGAAVFGRRRRRGSKPLIALYARWRAESDSESLPMMLEACEQQWYWCSPVVDGWFTATVFMDPKSLTGANSLMRQYTALMRDSKLFQRSELSAHPDTVAARDASIRYSPDPVREDFIRVGDSALSLDPISSQGVQTAVISAIQAAAVVHTQLTTANGPLAEAFYTDRLRERRMAQSDQIGRLYADCASRYPVPFWIERSLRESAMQNSTSFVDDKVVSDNQHLTIRGALKFKPVPVMEDELIVSREALIHETLERPVAYVGSVEIVPLLNRLRDRHTVGQILGLWSDLVSAEMSRELLNWLLEREIVVLEDH